jgi:ATP-binding cassette subfamily C protein
MDSTLFVSDRGILLSQGERQRLALARAFLRSPSMLILDEATNSLDSENEGRVLDAIERRRGVLTVVLIAHRLSTVNGELNVTFSPMQMSLV